MNRPSITTVIPTKGMEPLLGLCVEHLRRSLVVAGPQESDRIVIIDNATEPPITPPVVSGTDIHWIRFGNPRSFAFCCNEGMRLEPNQLYLMLNNDVILHDQAIAMLVDAMNGDSHIGLCGARLVFPNGTIQHCGIRFGPPELGPYHVHRASPSRDVARGVVDYQAVTGACMLIRSEVIDTVGPFDEDYPFSFEDIDFCLRARQEGWRVVCANSFDSLHFESMTPGRLGFNDQALSVFLAKWKGRWSIDG